MDAVSWPEYLAAFHQGRPGITEAVLSRVHGRTATPYAWLLGSGPPPPGRVLDLACGSAPLWPMLRDRPYVGLDASAAELTAARRRGAGPLLHADAAALPLADGSVRTLVCAMALQLVQPLPLVLAEAGRVLAPGGRLLALVPDRGPLRGTDALRLAGLLAALGRGPSYPNDPLLRHRLPRLLAGAGLRPLTDERRRFAIRLREPADADLLLDSLYLPGVPQRRLRAARRWLHGLARVRATVPVPLRRIVAERTEHPPVLPR